MLIRTKELCAGAWEQAGCAELHAGMRGQQAFAQHVSLQATHMHAHSPEHPVPRQQQLPAKAAHEGPHQLRRRALQQRRRRYQRCRRVQGQLSAQVWWQLLQEVSLVHSTPASHEAS